MASGGMPQQMMNFNHNSNGLPGFSHPNGHSPRIRSPSVSQHQMPFNANLNGNGGPSHQPSPQMGFNPNGVGLMHPQGALGFNPGPNINGGGPSNHHNPAQYFDNPMSNNPGFQQPMMPFNQGMPGMGMNGMNSFTPAYAQVFQDAMRLKAPVGAYDDDQRLLVEVLYQSTRNGTTYRQALESLHGRNHHASSLWKDYYLDHKSEIDRLVAAKASPQVIGIKGPPIQRDERESYKREESQSASASLASKQRSQPIPAPVPKRAKPAAPAHPADVIKTNGRRQTINSLTTPNPVYDEKNPPPANEIVIPTPPSRSPTPPTIVIPGPRGNKYTPEDRDYFIKFIGWRLKCDPSLTKQDLCELLAEKVPHHTAGSWNSHWGARHELADRILSAADQDSADGEGEDDDEDDAPVRPAAKRSPRKRPNYVESSEGENSSSSTDADASGSEEEEDEYRKTKSRPARGGGGGGGKGTSGVPFTDEDFENMAAHVATMLPEWDSLSRSERWKSFTRKYPKRSEAAWAEHYRTKSDRILSRAKVLQTKNGSQINGHRHEESSLKRKSSYIGEEPGKRPRE
ncbi:hypothetical protein HGRIS_008096 [Hohenbuehelia grisea]|uniref:Uncharacterized protein n=1 Tax=Hohenbuehelia grisea TaxID=104357 RepID=A0ABR3J8B5_9AGAR